MGQIFFSCFIYTCGNGVLTSPTMVTWLKKVRAGFLIHIPKSSFMTNFEFLFCKKESKLKKKKTSPQIMSFRSSQASRSDKKHIFKNHTKPLMQRRKLDLKKDQEKCSGCSD